MTDILWIIFELAINIYQGLLMTYFSYEYLGDKYDRKYFRSPAVGFGLLLAATITVLNIVTLFENFYVVLYILICFVYAAFSCKGRPLKKIFASILVNLIMGVCSTFVSNFMSVILHKELIEIFTERNIERVIDVIIVQLFLLFCIKLVLKLFNTDEDNNAELVKSEWILILCVFTISILIQIFAVWNELDMLSQDTSFFTIIVLGGIILINVAVCFLLPDLQRKNKAVRENEILRIKEEYSSQYIANAKLEYDTISKLRHDYKNNFTVIHTLLSDGNTAKAMEYIEENLKVISRNEVYISTDNEIANAVINSIISAAKSLDIDVTCISVKNFGGINDTDLCRLLSNMLENAVTACVNSSRKDKQISLRISSDEYKYDFCVKNTIDESVLDKNPEMKTTKSDEGGHGYGKRIINDIAEKYNGSCDFYEEDGMFCCHVILEI